MSDPNLRGIMVDDLRTGRRPIGSVVEAETDVNGVTSLVVGGVSHSLFGEQVVTVGVGGRFLKLKDACDYIATQNYIETLFTGSFTHAEGAKVLTANATLPVAVTGRQLYAKISTDSFLYPVEATAPGTTSEFKPLYPMWGRTPGSLDFSIVSPTANWVIVLMPGRHEGDNTPVDVPAFTSIIGYGKTVSIFENEASAAGRGAIEVKSTSQGVSMRGFGVQVHGANRGAAIVLRDVGTGVLTTGQMLEFNDLWIASTGASEDGIWKTTTTKNVIDSVKCKNIIATGYYDSFAIFNTVRTNISDCEVVAVNSDAQLPQGMQVSGNSLVNSDHRMQNNIIRARNDSTGSGASTIGIKLSASTAGTKHSYLMASNNQIECSGELDSLGITGFTDSKAIGILVDESSTAVGDLVVHSSNNIFDCSGARVNYAISSQASGVVFSSNDRNKNGTAITTSTSAGGALTVVL
jgi:hypothetical protein